jgi:hypothetical protein
MFSPRNRFGIIAALAALALTACGGRAVIPSNGMMPNSFEPDVNGPGPAICYTAKVQPAWILHGACVMSKLTSKGAAFKLPAYKGVTVNVTLPAGNSAGAKGGPFVLVDAIGGIDISKWKGKALPKIPATTGKSVIYVETVNSIAGLKFPKGNLVFKITTKKSPGSSCALSLLQQKGAKFSWFKTPITAQIKGGTATYTIPGPQLGILFASGLPKGPLFFNDACKP